MNLLKEFCKGKINKLNNEQAIELLQHFDKLDQWLLACTLMRSTTNLDINIFAEYNSLFNKNRNENITRTSILKHTVIAFIDNNVESGILQKQHKDFYEKSIIQCIKDNLNANVVYLFYNFLSESKLQKAKENYQKILEQAIDNKDTDPIKDLKRVIDLPYFEDLKSLYFTLKLIGE